MNGKLVESRLSEEIIVIPDECGDSMWDEVLKQEAKACEVKVISKNAFSLLNSIDAVQEHQKDDGHSIVG